MIQSVRTWYQHLPRVSSDGTKHTLGRESPVVAWIMLHSLVSSLLYLCCVARCLCLDVLLYQVSVVFFVYVHFFFYVSLVGDGLLTSVASNVCKLSVLQVPLIFSCCVVLWVIDVEAHLFRVKYCTTKYMLHPGGQRNFSFRYLTYYCRLILFVLRRTHRGTSDVHVKYSRAYIMVFHDFFRKQNTYLCPTCSRYPCTDATQCTRVANQTGWWCEWRWTISQGSPSSPWPFSSNRRFLLASPFCMTLWQYYRDQGL